MNTTDPARAANTTSDFLAVNLTVSARGGEPAEGLTEDEGLSEGETLREMEAETEALGERLGEIEELHE